LDLPIPTTISDWDTTLRAFKQEYDATLITHWNRFHTAGFVAGAFGAYGSTGYRLYIDPRTDTIELAQVQPEWKDFIEHMNMWWTEGLINQDLLTLDDSLVRPMMLNDESGLSFSAMSQITNWTIDAEEAGSDAHWIGIPTPTADDGSISMIFGGPGITGFTAGITNSVGDDRLEIVMRILDYAYSPEGHIYWNFGIEGVSYNMVGGVPVFSDYLRDSPDGINEAMQLYSGTIWGAPAIQATEIIVSRNLPVAVEANNTWFYSFPELAVRFQLPRGMGLNAAEANRAGEIEGAIQTYVNEMTVQFMTGAEPIANFDSFVNTIGSMGLEELLSLYQAAYERFKAR
jgi:putative aldouronate transport system substrate-binding protein